MEKVRQAMETALKAHWESDEESPAAAPARPSPPPAQARRFPSLEKALRKAAQPPPVEHEASDVPRVRVAAVDEQALRRARLVAGVRESPEREPYCILQAAVAERLERMSLRTLGVTAPADGAGKTLTAANLAISLALESRRRVVLIDLDLRHPTIHELFGQEAGIGLESCLFDGAALPGPLFSPSIDGLVVLPARGGSTNVAQILGSSGLKTLLREVAALYPDSILVIDLPPITSRADAAVFERLADALLLVVDDGTTTEAAYRRAVESIARPKLLGTVLNHTQPSA
jgi:capsular exopolysaccharide synthesis family protein